MSKSVGIGVIGCGHRIKLVLAHVLAGDAADRLRVVAGFDPEAERVQMLADRLAASDIAPCGSPEQVATHPGVDWVFIGSPNALHADHAVAALNAGKHVFCEKPLATTLADCLRIREALEQSGTTFAFGLVLRYAPLYTRVATLLNAGRIGELISFEFNETLAYNHGGYLHQGWRSESRWTGSFMLEKCCHDIDIANWLVGCPASRVASFGGCDFFTARNAGHLTRIGPDPQTGMLPYQAWPATRRSPFSDGKDIVDNQVALIEYRNGVRATFHTNCNAAIPERRLYLIGSEGTLRADLITGQVELRRIGWDEPSVIYETIAKGHGGGDERMAKHLVQTMVEGVEPLASLEHGLAASLTCFAMDQAMREGRVVYLSELQQQLDSPAAVASRSAQTDAMQQTANAVG